MFPEELPRRLIKMFSFTGETVFDPFLGSGTTALAAKNLGRNSVGYEINRDFEPIIREKMCTEQTEMGEEASVFFYEDVSGSAITADRLPYLFHDPHRMDKKVDIKRRCYGSKIDGTEVQNEKLYGVQNVLSPERIELSGGIIVRLLGVHNKPGCETQAIEYLKGKFRKRKVFLRYDTDLSKAEKERSCYVYLDNKTFVNRHLLRTGYVNLDETFDGKYKKKFAEDADYGKRMDSEQRYQSVPAEF